MTDTVDGAFQDLYYPGSKQKRRDPKPAPPSKERPVWDDHPLIKKLHGKDVEMFTIGALCKALGKSEQSIRLWQGKGYLPNTPYRLPTIIVNGHPRAGRRLFTRPMIEAVIEIFERHGLLDAARIEWGENGGIPGEIAEAWLKIAQSYKAV